MLYKYPVSVSVHVILLLMLSCFEVSAVNSSAGKLCIVVSVRLPYEILPELLTPLSDDITVIERICCASSVYVSSAYESSEY